MHTKKQGGTIHKTVPKRQTDIETNIYTDIQTSRQKEKTFNKYTKG